MPFPTVYDYPKRMPEKQILLLYIITNSMPFRTVYDRDYRIDALYYPKRMP